MLSHWQHRKTKADQTHVKEWHLTAQQNAPKTYEMSALSMKRANLYGSLAVKISGKMRHSYTITITINEENNKKATLLKQQKKNGGPERTWPRTREHKRDESNDNAHVFVFNSFFVCIFDTFQKLKQSDMVHSVHLWVCRVCWLNVILRAIRFMCVGLRLFACFFAATQSFISKIEQPTYGLKWNWCSLRLRFSPRDLFSNNFVPFFLDIFSNMISSYLNAFFHVYSAHVHFSQIEGKWCRTSTHAFIPTMNKYLHIPTRTY